MRRELVALASTLLFCGGLSACGDDTTEGRNSSGETDAGVTSNDTASASDTSSTSRDTRNTSGPETAPTPDSGPTPDPDPDTGPTRDTRSGGEDTGNTPEDTGSSADTSDTPPDAEEIQLELTSVTPSRGPVEGGTQFVLGGTGLTQETTVYFGSRKAEADLVNDQLVGQTPEGASPGTVPVKALDPNTGDDVIQDGFEYQTTLEFRSASPDRLPIDGGTTVTIEGTGFDDHTRASFDGRTARRHTLVDSQTLRVVAPGGDVGSADLRLTNRDATVVAEDAISYVESLELDRVRPATGSLGGGTQVTLHGRGFSSKMTVEFGSATANVVSVESNGQKATVRTPPRNATGLVDVSISAPQGDATLLEDAFYYQRSDAGLQLVNVDPDVVRRSGNVEVDLRGTNLDAAGLTIRVGGNKAQILDRGPGHATIEAPSHAPGLVDVSAATGTGTSATLNDAIQYVEDLWVDKVTPSEGKTRGNAQVTIKGQGFESVESKGRVRFGDVSASFSVVDDTTINATAPHHAAGTVDVTVERGEVSATLQDGFTYTEALDVFGLSPIRGSMAGDTYVVIRGQGFQADQIDVTFGSEQAKSVEVLDPNTLATRTPAQQPQAVDVTVSNGSTQVTASQQYTYFNPGARNGGTWGSSIQGAVNVSVYSKGGQPVPRAFVMLSTNPDTTYKGKTDRNGLVTLSGPEVYGEQTITAVAPKYSSTTIQRVDSENITIFLNPPTSNGQPPPGPPTATFKGNVTGLKKIAQPDPDEIQVAIVRTTKESPWSNNPDPGDQNVVRSSGTYKLDSRVGDVALVAIGGLQNRTTGEFDPLRMGVKRYQFAAQGKTYTRDIDLDIPLNRTMSFKVKSPPKHPEGPDTNRVVPYLDFGFEGVFGGFDNARGDSNLLEANKQPQLSGPLSDITYTIVGGTYTEVSNDSGGEPGLGSPQSVAIKRDVQPTGTLIELPNLPAVPRVTSPQPNQEPVDGLITFKTGSSQQPDFYHVQVLTPRNRAVWDVFLPGSANSMRLPDFPDFSNLPRKRQPNPYPGGIFQLSIIGIQHPGVTYNNFSYNDLSIDRWSAYSVGGQQISFSR